VNNTLHIYLYVIIFFFIAYACKTLENISAYEQLRPMSSHKLLKNMESNAFQYDCLSIQRIHCQFKNNNTKVSFKAILQAEKNKKILLRIYKINVLFGHVYLTPDSVKFINYLNKTYLISDYQYVSKMLGIDINFEQIQSLIANQSPIYYSNTDYFRSYTDSGMYVLQSRENQRTRTYSIKQEQGGYALQTFYIDPRHFTIQKCTFRDFSGTRQLYIEYADFEALNSWLYPKKIHVYFYNDKEQVAMRMRLNNISLEQGPSYTFTIPDNYKPLNVNR
jgi:hypothetical protein